MRVLGIRAEPTAINWAVVEGTKEVPVVHAAEKAEAPVDFDEAAALAWLRERTLLLIDTYNIARVAIRFPEPFSRGPGRGGAQESSRRRCRVEGILLEAAHSRNREVETGALVTISSKLGTKTAKKYLEDPSFRGLEWAKRPKNLREAILVGVAALGD